MAVVGIGQLQHIDELFEIRDQRIACVHIHQIARSREPHASQIST
jgi:hypothetical protein